MSAFEFTRADSGSALIMSWAADDAPGALDAGAVHFIDHALATDPVAAPLKPVSTEHRFHGVIP